MKWERARKSRNVEDRRGQRMAAGGGIGLGGIAIVVVVSLVLGKNPMDLIGLVSQTQPTANAPSTTSPGSTDEANQFVAAILGETEDVWSNLFATSGATYPAPTLVLFTGQVRSACGSASSAMGPFYCPRDRQVYIDLSFFDEMERRLGGGGDFAEAYVIAHEVGHHVQTVTGSAGAVHEARRAGRDVEGDDGLLVRQELQADCYAGVWAHHAQTRHQWLEAGDIEEALATASAIGDDRLQRQSRGVVVPDAFTHGSAEQRVRWFRTGFEHGEPGRCDTFEATAL
jgi:predicted metalloprotease